MAANGAQQVYEPVLAAHNLMQSASNRTQKEQAHEFLEKFQKSVCWAKPRVVADQIGLTGWVVARSMDNNTGYARVELCGCCSEAFRCHHPQGQGALVPHRCVLPL